MIAVCALQEEDADCIHWCKLFAKEFEVLRNWETEAAKGSLPHHKVLAKLTWRLEPLPRAFCYVCDRAARNPNKLNLDEVRRLAHALSHHFLDEKAPEDMHQHIRDTSRNQRSKRSRLLAIHEAVIRSGVLEDRKIKHRFRPDDQDVVRYSWTAASQRLKAEPPLTMPKDAPLSLNKILKPTRDWTSPTVRTLYESCMTLFWMKHREQ